jgi:hypothetical protein
MFRVATDGGFTASDAPAFAVFAHEPHLTCPSLR